MVCGDSILPNLNHFFYFFFLFQSHIYCNTNYQPQDIHYDESIKVSITLPTQKADGTSIAECRFVDDSANFFPKWVADRDARGLETKGRWSEDSPEIMAEGFDPTPYEPFSRLIPQMLKTTVKGGMESLEFTIIGNSAVFVNFTE